MTRGKATLEWQVVEDPEYRLPEVPDSPGGNDESARKRKLPRHGAVLAVLFLTVALIGVQGSARLAEHNLARIETDLQALVIAEAWARQSGDSAVLRGLVDSRVPDVWQKHYARNNTPFVSSTEQASGAGTATIENLELRDDLAMIKVFVAQDGATGSSESHHEVRFYRQTEEGWVRTAPQATFWGPPLQMATEHFVFEYRQRDGDAVEEVSGRIEQVYSELRHTLGPYAPAVHSKLIVKVEPAVIPRTDIFHLHFAGDEITVPSPLLMQPVEEAGTSQILFESISAPLAEHILAETVSQLRIICTWQPVADAVGSWMREQYRRLPTPRRQELARAQHASMAERVSPFRLVHLTASMSRCAWYPPIKNLPEEEMWQQLIAAETLVEYVVANYGTSTLLEMLNAFRYHYTWSRLIPAVFSVPAREFETGWLAYQLERYAPLANTATNQ